MSHEPPVSSAVREADRCSEGHQGTISIGHPDFSVPHAGDKLNSDYVLVSSQCFTHDIPFGHS